MSSALSPSQLDLLQRCSKDEVAFAELRTFAESLLATASTPTGLPPQSLEFELRESERHYRELLENLPIAIAVMDNEDFRLLFANAVTRKLFDTPLPKTRFDEFWQAHLSPVQQATSTERFGRLAQGEHLPPIEYQVHLANRELTVVNEARQIIYEGRPATLSILTDITEHKRMEATLRESEERYRNISEIGADYAFQFNIHPDGRIERVWLTEAFERITGYTRDESAQRGGWLALGHPDDQAYMIEEMKAILSAPGERTTEYRLITKSGEVRHIWGHGRSVADETGRIVTLYGVAQDVTDLKRIEQTLAEREGFIQKIADTAPCIIAIYDLPAQCHIYANRYTANFVGLPHAEIKTQPRDLFKDAFHPDDQPIFTRFVETVMQAKDGEVHQAEIRVRRHDGAWRWCSHHNMVFERDASGAIKSVIAVIVDITEQRHAEEVLQERERFIQRVADTAPCMITVFDFYTQHTLYANRYANEFLGLAHDYVATHSLDLLKDSFHPDDKLEIMHYVESLKAAQDGEVISTELRLRRHDGVWRWFRFHDMVFERDAGGAVRSVIGGIIDITEQRHAEQVLQERERFIQRVMDTAPGMITVFDVQANHNRYANRLATEFVGLPPDSVTQHPIDLFGGRFHPADRPALRRFVATLKRAKDGVVHQAEVRVQRHDGAWRWFRFHDMVFERDAAGKVKSLIAVIVDITEQRHAEEMLQERERFIQQITDTAPCMISVYDMQAQNNLYINRYAADYLGIPYEIAHSGSITLPPETFHPDDAIERERFAKQAQQAEDGMVYESEMRIRRHDGEWRWFRWHDRVFERDEAGKVKLIVTILIDITEVRQAKDALQERERFIQKISDTAPCMIVVYDVEQRQNIYFNRYTADFVGVLYDAVQNRTIGSTDPYFHPADLATAAAFRETLNQAEEGNVYETEIRMRRHDGVWRWFRWYNVLFERNAAGQVKSNISILVDATDQKAAQEALIEQERLRVELGKEHELGLLKTKMMQRISHEFRTPLAVIISSSYLLQYPNLPEDKRRHQFNTVQTQIARITAMLEDIQVILNSETELTEFYPIALDFREVVDAAFEKVQTTQSQPRTLDLHIAAPLQQPVVVDERLLRLILINLISNALKFSEANTPVSLSAEVVKGHLQLSIQDWGIGIPPEDQSRIFEPFYRANNFDERPGLGLGLTIVKNAVELHKGTISVTSNPATGTTFTVRLPLRKG